MCFSARASSSLVYEWNTHRMKRVFSAPWCSSRLILGLNKTSAHATDLDYPVSLNLNLYLFLKTSMRTRLPEQVRGWTYVILKVGVGGRPCPPCDKLKPADRLLCRNFARGGSVKRETPAEAWIKGTWHCPRTHSTEDWQEEQRFNQLSNSRQEPNWTTGVWLIFTYMACRGHCILFSELHRLFFILH